jgi:osmotically-inducible protein OsmY
MKRWSIAVAATSAAVALSVGSSGTAWANDPATRAEAAESAADDTGRNVRDRAGDTLTPTDQSNRESDVELTRKIREGVVSDDSLSLMAHNVKIISVDGVVTLRGPVENEAERERIASLAEKSAGSGKVRNHLEVAR